MTTLTHERDKRPRPASPTRPGGPLTWSLNPRARVARCKGRAKDRVARGLVSRWHAVPQGARSVPARDMDRTMVRTMDSARLVPSGPAPQARVPEWHVV